MQNRAEQHKKELAEAEVLYQETRAALVKSQEQATLLSQRAEGDAADILHEQGKRKRAEAEADVLRCKARGTTGSLCPCVFARSQRAGLCCARWLGRWQPRRGQCAAPKSVLPCCLRVSLVALSGREARAGGRG